MKSLYELYETNTDLEKAGVWMLIGPDGVNGKFHVARAGGGNTKYLKAMDAKTRPFRKQIENGTIDQDFSEAIVLDLYVDTVLLGWENVRARPTDEQKLLDEPGDLIPFSKAAAKKLLTEVPDYFNEIRAFVSNFTNFRAAEIEADAGN